MSDKTKENSEKKTCECCEGTGMGSLTYGANSKCSHCGGKGYNVEKDKK